MRFTNLVLGIFGLAAMSAVGAACSSSSSGGTGGSTSSGTAGTTSSGAATCAPTAACTAADKTCLGLVDNSKLTKFGLRMSELDLTAPAALTTGIVKSTVQGNVTPDEKPCNLDGSATFSWLLQFDTVAGTLKTGGAKPVTDPSMGYSFDDEMITQGPTTFHVQPITYTVTPDATGKFSVVTGQDLIVPIFLNATGSSVVLLPLKAARLTMGTLSTTNNCVGSYNASTLDPKNSCQPDATHPQFTDGASLDGYITLKDADTVIVSALSQSLCVLLSANATMYGMMNSSMITVCKTDANGNILFQGNWCDATNSAATSTCADSVALGANFAASSILINN